MLAPTLAASSFIATPLIAQTTSHAFNGVSCTRFSEATSIAGFYIDGNADRYSVDTYVSYDRSLGEYANPRDAFWLRDINDALRNGAQIASDEVVVGIHATLLSSECNLSVANDENYLVECGRSPAYPIIVASVRYTVVSGGAPSREVVVDEPAEVRVLASYNPRGLYNRYFSGQIRIRGLHGGQASYVSSIGATFLSRTDCSLR